MVIDLYLQDCVAVATDVPGDLFESWVRPKVRSLAHVVALITARWRNCFGLSSEWTRVECLFTINTQFRQSGFCFLSPSDALSGGDFK